VNTQQEELVLHMLSYKIQFIYYKKMRQADAQVRLVLSHLLSAFNGHILNVHHL